MKLLLISIIHMIGIYSHRAASYYCTTPDGFSGLCLHKHACEPFKYLRRIPEHLLTINDYLFYTYSKCNSPGQPKNTICCPHHKSKLVDVTPTACYIDDIMGTCKNIQLCPALADILSAPLKQSNNLYMDIFRIFPRCGNMEPHSVCCENEDLQIQTLIQHQTDQSRSVDVVNNFGVQCTMSSRPPDPQSYCCGLHGNEERIVGGSLTGIDQYPWLALIEYRLVHTNAIAPGCGGSLISGRYVLTAGHCLTGDILNNAIPVNVRLGEYDVSNLGPDCVAAAGGGDDCTEDPKIIPIEEIILHEQYNPLDANRFHDIAMIRLSETAPYTDFIRPICLPTFNLALDPPYNLRLYASGWGMSDYEQKISNIKRAVDLPYKPITDCEWIYNYNNMSLWQGQICAGGEKGKDYCKGDSGGPLMYKDQETSFTVVGIISYGPRPCGQKNVPNVNTNVYVYLQWIYNNIKP